MYPVRIAYYAKSRDVEELMFPALEARYHAQAHEIIDDATLRGYWGIYVQQKDAKAAKDLLTRLCDVYNNFK